jgi:hypothetical protein
VQGVSVHARPGAFDLGSPSYLAFVSPEGLSFQHKASGHGTTIAWSDMRAVRVERRISYYLLGAHGVMLSLLLLAILGGTYRYSWMTLFVIGGTVFTATKGRNAWVVVERASGPPFTLNLGSPVPGTNMLDQAALARGWHQLAWHLRANGVAVGPPQ